MPMHLVTGQPGNFKTCRTIEEIEKLRLLSGRPVFYWNIKGLKLDWSPLGDVSTFGVKGVVPDMSAAKRWFELPAGAIIVFDEAQRLFEPRSQGSKVPDFVRELETLRHGGVDMFCITQHPTFIDNHVRKLAGEHTHMVRRWGREQATVYTWEETKDPTSSADKRDARTSTYKPSKAAYGQYVSAEVHTIKRNLPVKYLTWAAVLIVLVIGGGMYAASHVAHMGTDVAGKIAGKAPRAEGSAATPNGGGSGPAGNPWVADRRSARVPIEAASAPMFDALQAVRSQPRVSGCMRLVIDGLEDCKCTDGQSARLAIPEWLCRKYVREGWFDETRPVISAKQQNIAYLNARDGQKDGGGSGGAATGQAVAGP